MSTKKKLKDKLKRHNAERKLMMSDFLVEKEKLEYRLLFSEGQVRSLMREKMSMLERLRVLEQEKNVKREDAVSKIPDAASSNGAANDAANTASNS